MTGVLECRRAGADLAQNERLAAQLPQRHLPAPGPAVAGRHDQHHLVGGEWPELQVWAVALPADQPECGRPGVTEHEGGSALDHIRVEAAAQAFVAGHDDDVG